MGFREWEWEWAFGAAFHRHRPLGRNGVRGGEDDLIAVVAAGRRRLAVVDHDPHPRVRLREYGPPVGRHPERPVGSAGVGGNDVTQHYGGAGRGAREHLVQHGAQLFRAGQVPNPVREQHDAYVRTGVGFVGEDPSAQGVEVSSVQGVEVPCIQVDLEGVHLVVQGAGQGVVGVAQYGDGAARPDRVGDQVDHAPMVVGHGPTGFAVLVEGLSGALPGRWGSLPGEQDPAQVRQLGGYLERAVRHTRRHD